ncbi:MAG: ribosome silencing factor [Clostridiales bacterium]|jgi:ribosome-associated protein|nr:ribosome silencing factor [Clostridiales bacterium]
MTPIELKNEICELLDLKKAADISVLDVGNLTVIADYFVIAGGTSTTNVKALAEFVEDKLKEKGVEPLRKDGLKDARWVVYDYGSVLMHILLDDMRFMYCLEKLWSDGKNMEKYVGEATKQAFVAPESIKAQKATTQKDKAVSPKKTVKTSDLSAAKKIATRARTPKDPK